MQGVGGYGPNRPIAGNESEESKRANRSIEIRFVLAAPNIGDVKEIGGRLGAGP
jgi:hypothetical protein